jgi:hypothetical protein
MEGVLTFFTANAIIAYGSDAISELRCAIHAIVHVLIINNEAYIIRVNLQKK